MPPRKEGGERILKPIPPSRNFLLRRKAGQENPKEQVREGRLAFQDVHQHFLDKYKAKRIEIMKILTDAREKLKAKKLVSRRELAEESAKIDPLKENSVQGAIEKYQEFMKAELTHDEMADLNIERAEYLNHTSPGSHSR